MISEKLLGQLIVEKPRPDYSKMKSEELIDLLFTREISRPTDDEGKLLRKQAIAKLTEWDDAHPDEYRTDPKVRVIFSRTGGASVAPYVFIGLNGRGYQVPYDTEVTLPLSVVRVCDTAVSTKYETVTDPVTQRANVVEKKERRYPYTIIGLANE